MKASTNILEGKGLIWQPFWRCESQCKNCYIKDVEDKSFNLLAPQQYTDQWIFLGQLTRGEVAWPDSLILSIDSVEEYTKWEANFFSLLLLIKEQAGCGTTLRLAVKDLTTLEKFINSLWTNVRLEGIVNEIAISKISRPIEVKYISDITGGHASIIWQLLANGWADKEAILDIAYCIDEVYLILEKPPLGEEFKDEAISNFEKMIEIVNDDTLIDTVTVATLDHCWVMAERGIREEGVRSCSAGIDRFCIWPTGTVTGCPYDTCGVTNTTKWAATLSSLMEASEASYDISTHPARFCKTWERLVRYHKRRGILTCSSKGRRNR